MAWPFFLSHTCVHIVGSMLPQIPQILHLSYPTTQLIGCSWWYDLRVGHLSFFSNLILINIQHVINILASMTAYITKLRNREWLVSWQHQAITKSITDIHRNTSQAILSSVIKRLAIKIKTVFKNNDSLMTIIFPRGQWAKYIQNHPWGQ